MEVKVVKRYHLKKGIKNGLLIAVSLFVSVMLLISASKGDQQAIDNCVANGYDYNYCVSGLVG